MTVSSHRKQLFETGVRCRGGFGQADPTVKFATGDFEAKRITGAMLKSGSPYNTYRYPGLPPGIIRYPGAATIDAVLNAPEHSYIYMCARPDGSGYHDFTSDYQTHLDNALYLFSDAKIRKFAITTRTC